MMMDEKLNGRINIILARNLGQFYESLYLR
jgi:hypothetical protein